MYFHLLSLPPSVVSFCDFVRDKFYTFFHVFVTGPRWYSLKKKKTKSLPGRGSRVCDTQTAVMDSASSAEQVDHHVLSLSGREGGSTVRFTQYFEQPARDSGQRRRERGPLLHSEVQPALRSWEPHSAVSDTVFAALCWKTFSYLKLSETH